MRFCDADDLVVADFRAAHNDESVRTIRQLYAKVGRKRFGELQLATLARIASELEPWLCATGGGVSDDKTAMDLLTRTGMIVFLYVSPETAWSRIVRKGIPAFLHSDDPRSEFIHLTERRSAIYQKYSDAVVDTSEKSVEEVRTILTTLITETSHGR
jgi:shikimate kinase